MKTFIVVCFLFLMTINSDAQAFSNALTAYFSLGDLTKAQSLIGTTVSEDDMMNVAKNYPGDGLSLSKSRPGVGVSIRAKGSMVILYSLTSRLVNENSLYEIWDVKGIELKPGHTVYTGRLMTQSLNFPNGNTEIPEAIGLLMIKVGEWVPVEKRLVPDWIITADKEGKLMISVPKDKSKYLYMQGG